MPIRMSLNGCIRCLWACDSLGLLVENRTRSIGVIRVIGSIRMYRKVGVDKFRQLPFSYAVDRLKLQLRKCSLQKMIVERASQEYASVRRKSHKLATNYFVLLRYYTLLHSVFSITNRTTLVV